MKVRITYGNGRISLFSTNEMLSPNPFGDANMLTNYELMIDEAGDDRIWLEIQYYRVSDSYRDEMESGKAPIARLQYGWRFVLVDPVSFDDVIAVHLDDKLIAWREDGVLVNGNRFNMCEMISYSGNPNASVDSRMVELYRYLDAAHPELEGDKTAVCSLMGIPESIFDNAKAREMLASTERE